MRNAWIITAFSCRGKYGYDIISFDIGDREYGEIIQNREIQRTPGKTAG
jgi:hypothetical protein